MKLKKAAQWRLELPGCRALILLRVGRGVPNSTILVKAEDEAPEGLYRLLGFV